MKKIVLLMLLAVLFFACKKENTQPDINVSLKGTWQSTLTTDVVIDNATNTELTRSSALHGLTTQLTFDGAGSVTSTVAINPLHPWYMLTPCIHKTGTLT